MTTDDQVCVALLDDVTVRQVLATRDDDDVAMILRLNLAACVVDSRTTRLLAAPARLHADGGARTVVGPTTVGSASADQWRSQRPTSSTV